MTTDAMELIRKIEDTDTEAFADVLVDTLFGNPADSTSGFEGYEAAKGLQSIVRNCESAHEFEIVNNTCIAIFGWSLATLMNKVKTNEEYRPSASNRDYGPSNPWDAPGMSIHDFI